jgi:hypothetical protein
MIGIADIATSEGKKITLGADPEVFLKDSEGRYVSAIGRFEGTKHAPTPVKSLGKGFAVQVDNVLLEYNIPAVGTLYKWKEAHNGMLEHLVKLADEQGLIISIDASAEMPEKELADPLARVFGCDPDFDAWNLRINAPPKSNNPSLRSAGGHIHIGGIGDIKDVMKVGLVQAMDVILGAWATLKDPDEKRKELYGRPGAMRFKDYGLEYRTISNFWLSTPENINTAYNLTIAAVKAAEKNDFAFFKYKEQIEKMFRDNDKTIAASLLDEFHISLADAALEKKQISGRALIKEIFNEPIA